MITKQFKGNYVLYVKIEKKIYFQYSCHNFFYSLFCHFFGHFEKKSIFYETLLCCPYSKQTRVAKQNTAYLKSLI